MRYPSHQQHPSKNIDHLMMTLTDKDRPRSNREHPVSYAVAVSVPSSTMHTRGSSTQPKHPKQEYSNNGEEVDKSISKGGVTTPFPWKLHEMLDDMAEASDSTVVCWQPHGRAFMVHSTKEFVNLIMPNYFNQTKYASFQRQLNLYGFSRLSHGKDKGAYFHPCFVRGQRNLCRNMIRQKIKGTKVRRSLSADEEPNFYDPQYHDNKSLPPTPASPVTPEVEKATKSLPSPSRVRSIKKRKKGDMQPPTANPPGTQHVQPSLVSLMRESSPAEPAALPVLPPPPVIRQLYALPADTNMPVQRLHHHGASSAVKGGDLLFFEGQPFRYLEHIDDVPSQPPTSGTLHDMISSIVNMENQWPPAAPRRPTGQQELCSR